MMAESGRFVAVKFHPVGRAQTFVADDLPPGAAPQPGDPIVVISPIYCPSAESRPGPTFPNADGKFVTFPGNEALRVGCMSLKRVREIISEVVTTRRKHDDNLRYLNGLELFGEADAGDLPDDLHPSPEGYARMGERFASFVSAHI